MDGQVEEAKVSLFLNPSNDIKWPVYGKIVWKGGAIF